MWNEELDGGKRGCVNIEPCSLGGILKSLPQTLAHKGVVVVDPGHFFFCHNRRIEERAVEGEERKCFKAKECAELCFHKLAA